MFSFKNTHCCGITEVQYIHSWIAPKVKANMLPKDAMVEFINTMNASFQWAIGANRDYQEAQDRAYKAQQEIASLISKKTPIPVDLWHRSSLPTRTYAPSSATTAYSFIFMTDTPPGKEDLQFFKDMVASCKYGEVTEGVKFINRNSGRTCQVVTWVLPESVFTARPSMIGYSDLIVPEDESK